MDMSHNRNTAPKRDWRWAVLAAALLLSCGWLGLAMMGSGARNSPWPSDSALNNRPEKASPLDDVILACPGRVEGADEVIGVSAAVTGVLTEVRVREGQRVVAGEVIATIACHDLKAELQAAQAAAESARQSRRRLLRGSREEERRIAADKMAEAEAVRRQSQAQAQRMATLFEKGDVSREGLEKARRDADVAEASWRAAVDQQSLVNAPPLPEEIARADSEVGMAEEQVRASHARIEKCTVRTPQAGTVLQRHLNPGEAVSAVFPQLIVSLADTSRLRVRAEVDERDVGRIYVGQPVSIMVDAFPEKRFAGSVSRIGALMGRKKVRTGDPAEKSDRDVLEVLIDLAERDERLVIGLRTTAQFLRKPVSNGAATRPRGATDHHRRKPWPGNPLELPAQAPARHGKAR
jgi:multidrug resistance efflux pump